MSYSEENGQVVLTMSRDNYHKVIFRLGTALTCCHWRALDEELRLLNRINEGNPNWTPFEVSPRKEGIQI